MSDTPPYIPGPDYRGKIRIYVTKIEKDPKRQWDDGFEAHSWEHFDDRLISDVKNDLSSADILGNEIDMAGVDMFGPQIEDILKNFQVGDTVEIVADAYIEYVHSPSTPDYPEEWDANYWFENILTHKLTPEQVKRFVDIEDEWADAPAIEPEQLSEPQG